MLNSWMSSFRHEVQQGKRFFQVIFCELVNLVKVDALAKRICIVMSILMCFTTFSSVTAAFSNSLALTGFSHLLLFDLLALGSALVTLWTRRQPANLDNYNFGYERFEVVAVFSSSILTILISFFELKEAVERLFEPENINHHHMMLLGLLYWSFHMVAVYSVENPAINQVISTCGSNWLQEHFNDMIQGVVRTIPSLTRFLLPRINPIALVGNFIALIICTVQLAMLSQSDASEDATSQATTKINENIALIDTIASVVISFMLSGTMLPIAVYCGRILLQTTPKHLVGQLDKALREATTLEGVLELRREHFWTTGFGKMAGSLIVRVRRDADEQIVLAHVTNRLIGLVQRLTIQVIKDDWTRASVTKYQYASGSQPGSHNIGSISLNSQSESFGNQYFYQLPTTNASLTCKEANFSQSLNSQAKSPPSYTTSYSVGVRPSQATKPTTQQNGLPGAIHPMNTSTMMSSNQTGVNYHKTSLSSIHSVAPPPPFLIKK